MYKIQNIPFGDGMLDTVEPVRIELDFRSRVLKMWLGLGTEDPHGVCIGAIDLTKDRPVLAQFPVLDQQLVLEDVQHSDPAAELAFEAFRQAAETFLQIFFNTKADVLHQEKIQVGRSIYPLEIAWKDRNERQHRQFVDRIEKEEEA